MIMKQSITCFFFSIVIIVLLLFSCAEPRMPQGGPRDSKAPQISTKKYSTPNEMTNFDYNQVILTFDEWVKIQKAYSQIIISPPLQERPSIKVRNKSVVIRWKEKLKDSTTYVINYGDAIQDITEGNKVKNMKRAFSTGSFIDSLSIQGQVVDAKTREGQKETLVMLYRNLADSMPLQQKPYYFARTDNQGRFKIDYIKKGRYQIFALQDENNDYKYNLPNESIAFLDSTFIINDTLQPILRLRMFEEKKPTQITQFKLKNFGTLFLKFNNKLVGQTSLKMIDAPSDFRSKIIQEADSILFWFDGTLPTDDKWAFEVKNTQENLLDTIRVFATIRDSFLASEKAIRWVFPSAAKPNSKPKTTVIMPPNIDTIPIKQNPAKKIKIAFNYAIQNWDSTKIMFLKDSFIFKVDSLGKKIKVDTFLSITLPLFSLDSNNTRQWLVEKKWAENKKYKIVLLPGAIFDFWGKPNTDTLARIYQIAPQDNYGNIEATVNDLDSTKQYIVQLIDDKEKIIASQIISTQKEKNIKYYSLPIGNYTIRIIHDNNKNNRWDTGNYQEKIQAEKITNSKKIALKAGWENKMDISIITKKTKKK